CLVLAQGSSQLLALETLLDHIDGRVDNAERRIQLMRYPCYQLGHRPVPLGFHFRLQRSLGQFFLKIACRSETNALDQGRQKGIRHDWLLLVEIGRAAWREGE